MGSRNPSDSPLSYFSCTLGQAEELNTQSASRFKTINDFLDSQAALRPSFPALGFPNLTDDVGTFDVFSFGNLRGGSIAVAEELKSTIANSGKADNTECIALLCHSSADFVFTWLGLIRLGYSVLLIAPQCQPSAIVSLVEACHASLIFHDIGHTDLAKQAALESTKGLGTATLPWQSSKPNLTALLNSAKHVTCSPKYIPEQNDTAYIHHSSGTSSGIPKPIPQSHFAAVGVLPNLDGSHLATFSTTPLYHGGIADCFRSWTSNALIWLFPSSTVPITSQNILRCISTSRLATQRNPDFPVVKYFSSVPFVLNMLAEESDGVTMLRTMDMVGVGGASLSPKVGDDLVQKGVKLLSRFGSAECGFLLSSQRDFEIDYDWQYLRVPACNKGLKFEPLDGESNLAELIVCKEWPYLAKTNRPDLSFATSDLFEQHPTTRNAWKYHSRSDGQITLSTGKKFDPAPLEEAIVAACSSIKDIMIVGTDRQVPGAIIFLKDKSTSDANPRKEADAIRDIAVSVGSEGESHTKLSRDMVLVMPSGSPEVLKSSKGTILRGPTEALFKQEIRALYDKSVDLEPDTLAMDDSQVEMHVKHIVEEILGNKLDVGSDFYQSGVDSIKSSQIRASLLRDLSRSKLPWNIVYDCGNIKNLTAYLLQQRSGKNILPTSRKEEDMLQFLEKYSDFNTPSRDTVSSRGVNLDSKVVVLTGATGALGANILQILRNDPSISSIICLVRATHISAAQDRVSQSLTQRQFPGLTVLESKIRCLPCHLNKTDLGLRSDTLHSIQQKVTHFVHAAWNVNFSLPLRSFTDDLRGLYNIINFVISCTNPVKLTFCSSTASVLGSKPLQNIIESISTSPSDSDSLGYSKSKWVAEAMCARASKHLAINSAVQVIRIGQLTAHTETGVWNTSEAWPLMLSTVKDLACLPKLEQPLNWLPLDTAANSVVEISLHEAVNESGNSSAFVFHVVNNSNTPVWSDLLVWIQQARSQPFEVVGLQEWLDRLNKLVDHPARKLLGLWEGSVGDNEQENGVNDAFFSTQRSAQSAPSMRNVPPLNESFVKRMWNWLDNEI